ncbi:hypothetical protein LQW54_000553 [Pestalotiopsis sp. IQ-011]
MKGQSFMSHEARLRLDNAERLPNLYGPVFYEGELQKRDHEIQKLQTRVEKMQREQQKLRGDQVDQKLREIQLKQQMEELTRTVTTAENKHQELAEINAALHRQLQDQSSRVTELDGLQAALRQELQARGEAAECTFEAMKDDIDELAFQLDKNKRDYARRLTLTENKARVHKQEYNMIRREVSRQNQQARLQGDTLTRQNERLDQLSHQLEESRAAQLDLSRASELNATRAKGWKSAHKSAMQRIDELTEQICNGVAEQKCSYEPSSLLRKRT